MIDVVTKKPLKVDAGAEGSTIELPVSQLEEVQKLLTEREIRYWTEETAFSFNGAPEVIVIHINHGVDPIQVQKILDESR